MLYLSTVCDLLNCTCNIAFKPLFALMRKHASGYCFIYIIAEYISIMLQLKCILWFAVIKWIKSVYLTAIIWRKYSNASWAFVRSITNQFDQFMQSKFIIFRESDCDFYSSLWFFKISIAAIKNLMRLRIRWNLSHASSTSAADFIIY